LSAVGHLKDAMSLGRSFGSCIPRVVCGIGSISAQVLRDRQAEFRGGAA